MEGSLRGSVLSEEGLGSAGAETGDASNRPSVEAPDWWRSAVRIAFAAIVIGTISDSLFADGGAAGVGMGAAGGAAGVGMGMAATIREATERAVHQDQDAAGRSLAELPIPQVRWREWLNELKDCRAKGKILEWTNKYAGLLSRS